MPPFPKPSLDFGYSVEAERAALRRYKESGTGRAIPERSSEYLLVASWRLHAFGVQERTDEDLALIAEILSWFDVTAVQGADGGGAGLEPLKERLPDGYEFLLDASGSGLAILYDATALQFTGEAGAVDVAPRDRRNVKLGGIDQRFEGFSRPPQFASFRRGPAVLSIANAHLAFGGTKPEDEARSKLEAFALGRWAERRQRSTRLADAAVLAVGRLNVPLLRSNEVGEALVSRGLRLPDHSASIGGSIASDQRAATAAFLPGLAGEKLLSSGVFDFDGVIFAELREKATARRGRFLRPVPPH